MISEIKKQAEQFNRDYFHNQLDLTEVTFKISTRMQRVRGKYYSRNGGEIVLSNLVMQIDKEWKNTLIHEMVHCFQDQFNLTMGHGKSFKNKSKEIELLSLGEYVITTKAEESAEMSAIRAKMYPKSKRAPAQIYVIHRPRVNGYNFLRNMKSEDIKYLESLDYAVYKYTGTLTMQCNKNLDALLRSRYYYDYKKVYEKIKDDLEEIKCQ